MKKVAIIGAGPAGIYSSLLLENFSGKVHLFDQNKDIGEKLKTTGGGRMNVTNKKFTDKEFGTQSDNLMKKLFKNPHFKHRDLIFEKLGIEYKWEKNRAILASQNAVEEVSRLKEKIEAQKNIELELSHKVTKIEKFENNFEVTSESLLGNKTENFDVLIFSSGGMYRMFDLQPKDAIYALPEDLGHSVTEVSPSLSPLIFSDKPLRKLSGTSFEGRLTDLKNKKFVEDDILITHFGVSGPAVLDFSAYRESESIEMCFTLKVKEHEFRDQINQLRPGKNFLRTFLRNYFSRALSDFFLEKSELSTETVVADLPKTKLHHLIQTIFHYPIPKVQSKNYPSSWTTKGGIKLDEINIARLESKLVPNCFFAGEIIDINGLCGGYNISFAAISAQIVADSILES